MSTTPSGRTRLAPDERREQILAHAVATFRATEYSAASLDTIAEEAGVTRGLLHHYFGSKRALYLEAVERSVHIPASVRIVPPGLTGPLEVVLDQCVTAWLELVRTAGGLWTGLAGTTGSGDTDVDAVLTAARDDLVERMIDELPLPEGLDRDTLRSALRAYSAFARVTVDEWLTRGSLDDRQAHALLSGTLLALIERIVPSLP